MDPSARLLAIEEIKQLKGCYFRFMDTKDWEGLRTIFCDDAVFDARAVLSIDPHNQAARAAESTGYIHRRGDSIADFIRGIVGSSRTVHRGYCHEVEIQSPDE